MAEYIGQLITVELKDGGKFGGKLVAKDGIKGKITLSKVICLTSQKKLPGNQTFYMDEIIPDSLKMVDEVKKESKLIQEDILLKKSSRTIEDRGNKRDIQVVHEGFNSQDLDHAQFTLNDLRMALEVSDGKPNINVTNVYKRLKNLSTREVWENTEPPVRPTSYIVIDSLGPLYDECVYRLRHSQTLGLAVEGVNISRYGKLCWLMLAAPDVVYLFDVYTMKQACFTHGIAQILSAPGILKIIHDCRLVSDMLHHLYDVKLVNVFDTQVASVMVFRVNHGGDLPKYVRSLQHLVEEKLGVQNDEYRAYKVRQIFKEEDEMIWTLRPSYEYLLDILAKRASYLSELRQPLLNDMLRDFVNGVDWYLSMFRDSTTKEYPESPEDMHTLPYVFRKMCGDEERQRLYGYKRNHPSYFDSNLGLVENYEQPVEICYRRDAVSHMKNKLKSSPVNYGVLRKPKPQTYAFSDYPAIGAKGSGQNTINKSPSSSAISSLIESSSESANESKNSVTKLSNQSAETRLFKAHKSDTVTTPPANPTELSVPISQLNISKIPSQVTTANPSPRNLHHPSGTSYEGYTMQSLATVKTSSAAIDSKGESIDSLDENWSPLRSSKSSPRPSSQPATRISPTTGRGRGANVLLKYLKSESDGVTDPPLSTGGSKYPKKFSQSDPEPSMSPLPGLNGNLAPISMGRGSSTKLFYEQLDTKPEFLKLKQCGSESWNPVGVDSSSDMGVQSGFQNVERMGAAPIDLDNLPPGFDIRGVNIQELLHLKNNPVDHSHAERDADANSTSRWTTGVTRIRHEILPDGTIVDVDTGLERRPMV